MKFDSIEYYDECKTARKCKVCKEIYKLYSTGEKINMGCVKNSIKREKKELSYEHYQRIFLNPNRFSSNMNKIFIYFIARKSGDADIPNNVYADLEKDVYTYDE